MISIRFCNFMPFSTRGARFPDDFVIGIKFRYDPFVITTIKDFFGEHRPYKFPERLILQPGGWLPHHKVWFVEKDLWPALKQRLKEKFDPIFFDDGDMRPRKWFLSVLGLEPPVTMEAIKQAYRIGAKFCHPDFGGTHEAFLKLKQAYDAAVEYVN